MKIKPVSNSDEIAQVAKLAKRIWRQHFTPIIGAAQVDYMLRHFQSSDAISKQIDSSWQYYLVTLDAEVVAYIGLIPDIENHRLQLSKIYVQASTRGKGVGKAMLEFIEQQCQAEGASTLWLTVNRFNSETIAWYQRQGFVIVDEVKKDIGGGFYMDDFIMEKTIPGSDITN